MYPTIGNNSQSIKLNNGIESLNKNNTTVIKRKSILTGIDIANELKLDVLLSGLDITN